MLLSATPHQGKTDQFMRLMQLLDREAVSGRRQRQPRPGAPFVIRTEKRASINAEGQPLFAARDPVAGGGLARHRHGAQQRLYEAVTDYVRHGYNQAMAAKQRHIGFLMILMQRLVTSSTAAIRTTLEKRQALLEAPQPQANLFEQHQRRRVGRPGRQSQVDLACSPAAGSWRSPKSRCCWTWRGRPRPQGHRCQGRGAAGADLQAAAGRRRPGAEGADLHRVRAHARRCWPTTWRAVAFGGDDAQRQHGSGCPHPAQQAFSGDVRVLISTDAGGEGLNLQFCHVIVNFDMPWNPMRIEQRIGPWDRIRQKHVVRAINFVLEDTVEHRVRQVLERSSSHRAGVWRRQGGRRDGLGGSRPDLRRAVRARACRTRMRSTGVRRGGVATAIHAVGVEEQRPALGLRTTWTPMTPAVGGPSGAVLAGTRHHQCVWRARGGSKTKVGKAWRGEVGGRQRVGAGLL